jgi:hypothetical protein
MEWAQHVVTLHNGQTRNTYSILVGKPTGKRTQDDRSLEVRMMLRRILKQYGVGWIDLAQGGEQCKHGSKKTAGGIYWPPERLL